MESREEDWRGHPVPRRDFVQRCPESIFKPNRRALPVQAKASGRAGVPFWVLPRKDFAHGFLPKFWQYKLRISYTPYALESRTPAKQVGVCQSWSPLMDAIAPPKSLTEQTYDILLNAICAGEFEPGERLNQDDIASRLKASRQPVNSAISILKANGFCGRHRQTQSGRHADQRRSIQFDL